MRKICPKCRREQKNPSLLGCEDCKVPYINEDELFTNFTRDELKVIASFILKDWRVYVVAGIILVAGVFLLDLGVGKKIENQVDKLLVTASNQVVAAYSTTTNQVAIKFQTFAQDASNRMEEAYSAATNLIVDKFREPNIRNTVENVAKREAKSILETAVQPAVDSFRADAQFLRLATRARAYDFKAYQRLLDLEAQTNENAYFAKQVVDEIDRSLEKDRSYNARIEKRIFMEPSGTHLYSGPFTPDEFATLFSSKQQDNAVHNREGFINSVIDLNQPLFLPQLFAFLTNEADLSVADRLTLAISQLSKQDFHPHDFEQIKQWWQSNQSDYTNWPVAELQRGLEQFASVHYSEAAESFARVLQIDLAADMSRALAVVCNWEIGETNMAVTLAKEFKNPDARWAKLAAVKAELGSGNISNATVQLAFFATNFPTFSMLPKEGMHAWRKIDWELFNKLTRTEKP